MSGVQVYNEKGKSTSVIGALYLHVLVLCSDLFFLTFIKDVASCLFGFLEGE